MKAIELSAFTAIFRGIADAENSSGFGFLEQLSRDATGLFPLFDKRHDFPVNEATN